MGPLDQFAGAAAMPSASEAILKLLMQQRDAENQQRLVQQKAQLQAQDPLRQAQAARFQAQAQPMNFGGGTPQGSTVITAFGNPSRNMAEANQRVEMILQALRQGDQPTGLDPMSTATFTPDYGTNTRPVMGQDTFRLSGFDDIGFNPVTGAFTNIGLPERAGAPAAQAKPKMDEQQMSEMAQFSQMLERAGMTANQRDIVLAQRFPQLAEQKRETERLKAEADAKQKRETQAFNNLHLYYDKKTGQPAGAAEDPPANLEDLTKNYMRLNTQQLADVKSVPQIQGLISGYDNLVKELPLAAEGLSSRVGGVVTMRLLRLSGSPLIAELDSLNSHISQLASAFGGDNRVTDNEAIRLLRGAVLTDDDTLAAARVKLKELKRFHDILVEATGIPWFKPFDSRDSAKPKSQTPTKQPKWEIINGVRFRVKE